MTIIQLYCHASTTTPGNEICDGVAYDLRTIGKPEMATLEGTRPELLFAVCINIKITHGVAEYRAPADPSAVPAKERRGAPPQANIHRICEGMKLPLGSGWKNRARCGSQ